ncbi:MAG: hypothetical protein PHO38_08735 [Acidithiobacillus sp.]|nr:hypothetical protein [Acidithiobacillus sp.]
MVCSMGSRYGVAITLLDVLLVWTGLAWSALLIWVALSGNGGSFTILVPIVALLSVA